MSKKKKKCDGCGKLSVEVKNYPSSVLAKINKAKVSRNAKKRA
jgi:hypothetical protein